jgi:hypothetical protein
VLEYEVPAFLASSQARTGDNQSFLDIPPSATIYSIWIGTNDLGIDAFLTDSQVSGKTIPDYIDCVFSALDQVYENGGRFFIIQNVSPLQLTPLYSTPERGGVYGSQYPSKATNVTETSYRMWEAVATVNSIYKYKTPFEVLVQKRYPDANFAVMDMYSIVRLVNKSTPNKVLTYCFFYSSKIYTITPINTWHLQQT